MNLALYTHCPKCNADLRLPNAVSQRTASGYGQCKACRTASQRLRAGGYTECRVCRKTHPPSTSIFCSSKCQGIARAMQQEEAVRGRQQRAMDRTQTILALVDAEWRAATHWERAAIKEKIEQLRQAQ